MVQLAKPLIAVTLVGALVLSTVAAIAAAEGMATIVVEVELRSPRSHAQCSLVGQLLSPEESGGYGYDASSSVGSYGYTFVNWLQNGYGYESFDVADFVLTEFEVDSGTIQFDAVPVGSYRVMVWCDLDGDHAADERTEPIAFAEVSDADGARSSIITLALDDHILARAVVAENEGTADGYVFSTHGAPLGDATVTALLPGTTTVVASTTSAADGYYAFPGTLPVGLYYSLSYEFVATIVAEDIEHASPAVLQTVGSTPARVSTLTIDLPDAPPAIEIESVLATPVDENGNDLFDSIFTTASLAATLPTTVDILAVAADASGVPIPGAFASLEDQLVDTTASFDLSIPGAAIGISGIDPAMIHVFALEPVSGDLLATLTAELDLGVAADYERPAIVIDAFAAAPFDDVDADTLLDGVRATIDINAAEPTAAIAFVQLFGADDVPLPLGFALLDAQTYDGAETLVLTVPAEWIVGGGIVPTSAIAVLFDPSTGAELAMAQTTLEPSSLSDYEIARLELPDGSVTYEPILNDDDKIERLIVRVEPAVHADGAYAFIASLQKADLAEIAHQIFPESGIPEPLTTDVIEIVFQGADLALLMGETDEIARITVDAFDSLYVPLGSRTIEVDPALARAAFAMATPAIELPAVDAASILVTCGLESLPCNGARPPSEASGWRSLNVRFPVVVNEAGEYALAGTVASATEHLDSAFDGPNAFALGTHQVELSFRGTEIYRRGVAEGAGDPARIDLAAFSALYEQLATTSRSIAIPATAFESLGVRLNLGALALAGEDLEIPVTLTNDADRAGMSYHVALLVLDAADASIVAFETQPIVLPASGVLPLTIAIDGDQVYAHLSARGAGSGTFDVRGLVLDPATFEILLSADGGPYGPFAIGSFSQPNVRILEGATSLGVDGPDADVLFDELRTTVPISVRVGHAGLYTVSAAVYDSESRFIAGQLGEASLHAGLAQIPSALTTFLASQISASGLPGPYTTVVGLFGPDGSFLDATTATSPRYLVNEFESAGVRITSVTDTASGGPARPAGPGYDGIRVGVQLQANLDGAGAYGAALTLYTASWSPIGSDERIAVLHESAESIDFVVPASDVRASGVSGYVQYFVYFYDLSTGAIVASAEGFLASTYNSAEFAIDGLEFRPASTFTDARSPDGRALRTSVGVDVGDLARYTIVGSLFTEAGAFVASASASDVLDVGRHTLTLDFDASSLLAASAEGPFQVTYLAYVRGFEEAARTPDVQTTAAYPLAGWSLARGLDLTSLGTATTPVVDGAIARLEQPFAFTVNEPGAYILRGSLLARTPTGLIQVAGAEQHITPSTGPSAGVMAFRGSDIARNLPAGYDDTLVVQITAYRAGLRVVAVDEISSATRAFRASEYSRTSAATLTGGYTWAALDERGDSRLDVFTVEVTVNVATGGTFSLSADLFSPSGRTYITSAETTVDLEAGARTITLRFDGGAIRRGAVDGAYRMTNIVLYNDAGILASATGVVSPTARAAAFS